MLPRQVLLIVAYTLPVLFGILSSQMKMLRKEHNVLDSILILVLRGKIPNQNGAIIATLIWKSMVSRKINNLLSDLTSWIKYRRDERQYKMRGVMFYRIFYFKGHIGFFPPRAKSYSLAIKA